MEPIHETKRKRIPETTGNGFMKRPEMDSGNRKKQIHETDDQNGIHETIINRFMKWTETDSRTSQTDS